MPDSPAAPPFYRYAAKFLIALATAIVGMSATILAAVDDDHITGKEWAAIVLGVLALLYGPAAVYAVRNASTSTLPADFVDKPVIRAHVDGTVDLVWPGGKRGTTWISPELLEGMVKTHNELMQKTSPLVDGSAVAARAYPPAPVPWTPPSAP